MTPERHLALAFTRRQLFSRTSTGIGVAALASLRRAEAVRAPTGLPGLPHFAPKAKRIIYPASVRRAVAHRPVRLQAASSTSCTATELPDSVRMGQRITGMTSGQNSFPSVAPMFKFAQHGKSRRRGSASCCRTPPRSSTTSPSSRSMHTEAINHDPAITFIQTGQPAAGTAQPRGLAQLRPGQREPEPAGVRRDDLAGRAANADQPLFSRLWGSGFLPIAIIRACGSAPAAIRSCTSPTRRASSQSTRRDMLDGVGELNQLRLEAYRRSGDQHAHRAVRDGVSHADLRAGADGSLEASREHVLEHVRAGRAASRGSFAAQLPAGAADGRARRAVRAALSSRLGPAQQSAAQISRAVPGHRPAVGGAGEGSEAARPAWTTRW